MRLRSFIPNFDDLRRTIRLAAPVAFVQTGMATMGVVDVIIVGHVSGTALASVALGNLYFFGAVIFGWARSWRSIRSSPRRSGRRMISRSAAGCSAASSSRLP